MGSSSPAASAPGPGPVVNLLLLLPLLPLPPPVLHHVVPNPFPILLQIPPPVVSLVLCISLLQVRRPQRLLPLPLLLTLLHQALHLLFLLRLHLLVLLLLNLQHRPLLISLFLPLLKIHTQLPIAVPLVDLLKLLDLLRANVVVKVVETGPELSLLSVEHVFGF